VKRLTWLIFLSVAFVVLTVVVANTLWSVSPWLAIVAVFGASGLLTWLTMQEWR
jgi:hypothetical protein